MPPAVPAPGQPTPAHAPASPDPAAPHRAGPRPEVRGMVADGVAGELEGRIRAVREAARARGLDALLLASPENLYYLLGLNHQGHFAVTLLVLPDDGPPLLVARRMERATVAALAPGCVHVPYGDDEDPGDVAAAAIRRATAPGAMVGVELTTMFLPVAVWDRLQGAVADRTWVDASGLVAAARQVKSDREVALMRQAAATSDRAVLAGIAAAGSRVTEREVAAAVTAELIRAGSEPPGCPPFVRSTDILDQEHVTWRDHELTPGSGLLLELSGSVGRYHAPLTRMVHIGHLPPGAEPAAATALAGLAAVQRTLRPGVLTGAVYDAWQEAVDERLGHHDYVRHHCGYLVGIGFPPTWTGGTGVVGIRRGGDLVVRAGMTFHVLSWILGQEFPAGRADYCVSDTALVTADGCELLTTTGRTPLVVP